MTSRRSASVHRWLLSPFQLSWCAWMTGYGQSGTSWRRATTPLNERAKEARCRARAPDSRDLGLSLRDD
jgi:hypothetical protein